MPDDTTNSESQLPSAPPSDSGVTDSEASSVPQNGSSPASGPDASQADSPAPADASGASSTGTAVPPEQDPASPPMTDGASPTVAPADPTVSSEPTAGSASDAGAPLDAGVGTDNAGTTDATTEAPAPVEDPDVGAANPAQPAASAPDAAPSLGDQTPAGNVTPDPTPAPADAPATPAAEPPAAAPAATTTPDIYNTLTEQGGKIVGDLEGLQENAGVVLAARLKTTANAAASLKDMIDAIFEERNEADGESELGVLGDCLDDLLVALEPFLADPDANPQATGELTFSDKIKNAVQGIETHLKEVFRKLTGNA